MIKVSVTFWSTDSSYSKVNWCERVANMERRVLTAWDLQAAVQSYKDILDAALLF